MSISVSPKAAQSLRITSIEVPPAVMNSSQVTLVCNYDLQGDQVSNRRKSAEPNYSKPIKL